ncbi:MAG TPA: PAS domain S-box protein, partial [Candidatus Marinimicrobia bacterium]|nr:PAS domain S-box protein [Candidatus Neomarinimicrobiota bacterium]
MKTKDNKDLQQRIQELLSNNYKETKEFHKKSTEEIYEEINIYHQELEFQNWELMRIREQLEKTKKHFELLYFDAPVGYATYNSDYIINSANHSLGALIGIEANEMTGRKITEFIHPDSQDFFWFHQNQLLKEGFNSSCELQLQYQKKSVWVKIDSNLFQEDNKTQIRTVFINISKEKAQQYLLEKQHKLTLQITNCDNVDELLQTSLQAAIDLIDMESGAIFTLDEQNRQLLLKYQIGLVDQQCELLKTLDEKNPHFRLIMKHETVYGDKNSVSMRMVETCRPEGVKSYAIIPLVQAKNIIGALMLYQYHSNILEPEKRQAIETISAVIAQTLAREMAYKRLQESEQKYRSLFQNTAVGIFRTKSTGKALHINPAMAKILGLPPDAEPVTDFNDLENILNVEPLRRVDFIELLKRHKSVNYFEFEARHFSGKNIWLSLSARISRQYDDGSFLIDGFVTDITQNKMVEKAYQYEKYLAQQYLDVAQIMLLTLDTEQRISSINPKGCQILGYSREEIIGKNWFDNFLVSDEIEKVQSIYNRLFKEELESLDYFENLIRRKDGSTRLIAWHNSYLRDDNKQIIGLFSSGEDITERRAAELSLAESERNFRLLFENSPLGTYIADREGNILDGNPALLNILGSPSLEATKKINVLTFPPLVKNGYADSFRECLKDGEIKAIQVPYHSKWGKSLFLSCYIV